MVNVEDKVKDTQDTINTASSKFENKVIDVFLDITNEAKNIINEVWEKVVSLNSDLYDYCLDDAEFYFRNKKKLYTLKERLIRFLNVIKRSKSEKLYHAVETSFVELEHEVNNYIEIVEDMQTKHENKPEDQRITDLLKDI